MRAWALGVLLTACYRGPAPDYPIRPDPVVEVARETEPSALVAVEPPPAHAVIATAPSPEQPAAIARDKQTVFVAGCNTACIDCGLGGYKTYVIGTLARTGERLFPPREPLAPGYSCASQVAVGERVTLRAHSPTQHLTIVSWSPFFERDACPCAGSTAQTCTFVVTPEIASRYDRIYCGAAWKQHAAAQIGH